MVLLSRIDWALALLALRGTMVVSLFGVEALRRRRYSLPAWVACRVVARRSWTIGVGSAVHWRPMRTWLACALWRWCTCDVALWCLWWLWPTRPLLPRKACRAAHQSHPFHHCLDLPPQLPQPLSATSTRASSHLCGQRATRQLLGNNGNTRRVRR